MNAHEVGARVEVWMGSKGWNAGEVLYRELDDAGAATVYAVRLDRCPITGNDNAGAVVTPRHTRAEASEKPN